MMTDSERLDRIIELQESSNAMCREALDANERRYAEMLERQKKQDESLDGITPESIGALFELMAHISVEIESIKTSIDEITPTVSSVVPA